MVEIELTLERSEHPDDSRLAGPITCRIEACTVPSVGEVLELPWPLDATKPGRAHATVTLVMHVWVEGDLVDSDGDLILVLRPTITAQLFDIDLDDDWEEGRMLS